MPFDLSPSIILSALGILLVDITLSGDNALVIGAAASRLHGGRRYTAILVGGLTAILLRLLLASVATELLTIQFLQAIGAFVLLWIAITIVRDDEEQSVEAKDQFWPAVLTILAADFTMSLDNVLAVAGLAHGNIELLVLGVGLSMVLLFFASALIANILERFRMLLYLAAAVLGWTAAELFMTDKFVRTSLPVLDTWHLDVLGVQLSAHLLIGLAVALLCVGAARLRVRLSRNRAARKAVAKPSDMTTTEPDLTGAAHDESR
jgi:YjbE family integral membrane protein